LTALLLKHQVIELEGIWTHLVNHKEDVIANLLDRQVKSLDYQYQMLFKTITNPDSFQVELLEK